MYPALHAATNPDKPAIIMGSGSVVTYAELEERSARLAQLLYAVGLRRGGNIAILAENHARFLEVYWAAIRSGLYLTTIDWHVNTDEAAYLVQDSGSQALVTTARMSETAVPLLDLIPNCRTRLMMDGAAAGFESYEDATARHPPTPLADQPRGDVMLYSSGTTGRPKGIKRQLSGLQLDDPDVKGTSNVERVLLSMDESSVYLCPAPLYHSAGIKWSASVHELGATLVVMEKFEAEDFLRLVERERVTHTQVVPTMLVRILKLPEATRARYDVSSLRCVLHAAAQCPIETKRQAIEWLGPIVDEFYAGTENVGMTFIRSAEWLAHPGSVGKPFTGVAHISATTTATNSQPAKSDVAERSARVPVGPSRRVQGPPHHRFPRRLAATSQRQALQAAAPQRVPGAGTRRARLSLRADAAAGADRPFVPSLDHDRN